MLNLQEHFQDFIYLFVIPAVICLKEVLIHINGYSERFCWQVEKQRLEADRIERQFLERERMRIEYERRREQERILRERDELRRQQDQLRYEQDRRPIKRPYDMDGRYAIHRQQPSTDQIY